MSAQTSSPSGSFASMRSTYTSGSSSCSSASGQTSPGFVGMTLGRVRDLVLGPLRRLVDARLRDLVAFVALRDPRLGLLPGLARHLVDELDARRDLALDERAADRVHHHRIRVVVGDDEHRLARGEDAHALALEPRLI